MSGFVILLLIVVGLVIFWVDHGDAIRRKVTGRCRHGRPVGVFCVECQQEDHGHHH